jgi:hypothetical protein
LLAVALERRLVEQQSALLPGDHCFARADNAPTTTSAMADELPQALPPHRMMSSAQDRTTGAPTPESLEISAGTAITELMRADLYVATRGERRRGRRRCRLFPFPG